MNNIVIVQAILSILITTIVGIVAIVSIYLNTGFKFTNKHKVSDVQSEISIDIDKKEK